MKALGCYDSYSPFGRWTWVLVLTCLQLLQGAVHGDRHADESRLIETVLRDYKADAFPDNTAMTGLGYVNVSIYVTPLYLNIDEENSILNQHCWFYLEWQDSRLRWDPKDYGGISTVHLPSDQLWKPNIYVYDSQVHTDRTKFDIVVKQVGPRMQEVMWVPAIDTKTFCNLDYTYWPWDVQYCKYSVGSWTAFDDQVVVNMMRNETEIYPYYQSQRWKARKITAEKNKYTFELTNYGGVENVTYSELYLTYELQRLSGIDQKLAILPLTALCCLILANFWTSPLDRNRVLIALFALAVGAFWLSYMRTRLPGSGSQIPMIVTFMGSTVVLVTLQLITALAVANLVPRKDSPPAAVMDKIDNGILGKILLLNNTPLVGKIQAGMPGYTLDVERMKDTTINAETASEPQANPTPQPAGSGWNLLVQAIDRILFVVYLLIMCIYFLAYIGGAASKRT